MEKIYRAFSFYIPIVFGTVSLALFATLSFRTYSGLIPNQTISLEYVWNWQFWIHLILAIQFFVVIALRERTRILCLLTTSSAIVLAYISWFVDTYRTILNAENMSYSTSPHLLFLDGANIWDIVVLIATVLSLAVFVHMLRSGHQRTDLRATPERN